MGRVERDLEAFFNRKDIVFKREGRSGKFFLDRVFQAMDPSEEPRFGIQFFPDWIGLKVSAVVLTAFKAGDDAL